MTQNGDKQSEPSIQDGFAPRDYTDHRNPGEWRSRYEPDAQRQIRIEVSYLVLLFVAGMVLIIGVWIGYPQKWLGLSGQIDFTLTQYCLVFLSGLLGGILFAMKWLYHSVAKARWNEDRRWWRFLTPLISGGLAFFSLSISQSLGVLNPNLATTREGALAFGFLVGFFSDKVLAKLSEIADTVFGTTRQEGPKRR